MCSRYSESPSGILTSGASPCVGWPKKLMTTNSLVRESLRMNLAVALALRDEMASDERVVIIGEDIGAAGGVFKTTHGLLDEFGPSRVCDTPISEMGFVGLGVGAAMCGLRPVVEVMFAEFLGVCLDQIVTEAALMRYLSGGTIGVPLTIRASAGAGLGFGAQHSQTLETWLMSAPGLKVVVPSDSMSAYGLLRAAIRDEDPVVVLEPRALYATRGRVDRSEAAIPRLGQASVLMHGDKATLVGLGSTVATCLTVAERMGGVALDVIDLRTLKPWDTDTVSESVEKTGALVVVEESPTTGGWGTEIVARISSACWSRLRGPIARVACPDVPVPFSKLLESQYLPTEDEVMRAVDAVTGGDTYRSRWEAFA